MSNMKVPCLDSTGKLHVLDFPRLIFGTRDYSYYERVFTFRILKKPKQPIREKDRVPCWIDIRIPPLWIVYYQHKVLLLGGRYKFFRIPVGYGEHYFIPPRWLLRRFW
jgi:hypothetical protein